MARRGRRGGSRCRLPGHPSAPPNPVPLLAMRRADTDPTAQPCVRAGEGQTPDRPSKPRPLASGSGESLDRDCRLVRGRRGLAARQTPRHLSRQQRSRVRGPNRHRRRRRTEECCRHRRRVKHDPSRKRDPRKPLHRDAGNTAGPSVRRSVLPSGGFGVCAWLAQVLFELVSGFDSELAECFA